MAESILSGTLYVVPTPIGNLEDITLRALHVLKEVTIIAAEDTRTTKFLLDHFDIQKPLISFYSHNEEVRVPQIIQRLKNGDSVALVSDAGTPGISDPAHSIITAAIANEIRIIPLPGPTAFVPALVASGMPTHEFVFAGFLPHKKGRKTKMERLREEERTVILYESVHRIEKTLQELLECFGDRNIVIGRELTKKFEEIIRGTLYSVLHNYTLRSLKGEFVLVIEGKNEREPN
jgi:16S rRNA (cytidine1402-2'-O)-methyltransferase